MIVSAAINATRTYSNFTDSHPTLSSGSSYVEQVEYQYDGYLYRATRSGTYDTSRTPEEQGFIPTLPTLENRIFDARTETKIEMSSDINFKFTTTEPATDIGISNVHGGSIIIKPPSSDEIELIPNTTVGKWEGGQTTIIERAEDYGVSAWPSGEWEITIYVKPETNKAWFSVCVPSTEMISKPTYTNLQYGTQTKSRVEEREYGTPDIIHRTVYTNISGEFPVINRTEEGEIERARKSMHVESYLINPGDASYTRLQDGAEKENMAVAVFTYIESKQREKDDRVQLREYEFKARSII